MTFARVVGHERAVAQLRQSAVARGAGAILLHGPAGVGKRALADAFAAWLVCGAPADDDACGRCPHCTRLASGNHPDVYVVARDEGRRDIRIDQVRELCRWLGLQPLMAARKVAIVDGAHELNEHGQNALLKTLEEPPGASALVLVAASAALVLPTVRSRCQMIRVDPLAVDTVARVLEARGVEPERARLLAALGEGAPGRALGLAGEDEMRARQLVLTRLPRLRDATAAEVSQLAQALGSEPLEAALAAIVAWYRDVLATTLAGEGRALRNPDVADAVREAAARAAGGTALRQLEVVCDTITALERNANRMLALETMFLALRDLERAHPARAAVAP